MTRPIDSATARRLAAAAVVTALAAFAAWHRYRFLAASPYPVGIDGYYYPVQLRALLETGALRYPTSPLALWLMAPLAALTDPITGAKLGAAILGALAVVPAYLLGRRLGDSRALGVLAAAIVATSAQSFYLTAEFAKNAAGVTLALGYLAAFAAAAERPSVRTVAIAVVLFLAAGLTHKTAFGLAVFASVAPLAWLARGRGWRWPVIAALGASALAIIAGLAAPERFIGSRDLVRAVAALGAPRWQLPVFALGDHVLVLRHEVAFAAALSSIALVYVARHPSRDRMLVIGPAALSLIAALPWLDVADPDGIAMRLRLLTHVGMALSAALVAGAALRALPLRWHRRGAIAAGFAAGLLAAVPPTTDEGIVRVHPTYAAAIAGIDVPPGDVVLVLERQALYMVPWYTGARARMAAANADPSVGRWRLLSLPHIDPPMRDALARARLAGQPLRSLHPGHEDGVVLIPEDTWLWLLNRLPPEAAERWRAWPRT